MRSMIVNERIKELAEESGIGYLSSVHPSTLEKFAELIVRECLKVMDQQWIVPDEVYQAMQDIKKHFGVE